MMLTVLIADDEQHIRDGITNSIQWNSLGIDKVLQAADGSQALELAESNKIDILITDIRMPRIDGIELSKSFRKMYPNCIIIFMSAYSDKEYFLSAIELKCTHFIEKPIQIEELQNAVNKSVKNCQEIEYARLRSIIVKNNMKISLPLIKNEIAMLVTNKKADTNLLCECLKNEMLGIEQNIPYITAVIDIFNSEPSKIDDFEVDFKLGLMQGLKKMLNSAGIKCFYGSRNDEEFVVHMSGYSSSNLTNTVLSNILHEWYIKTGYKKIFMSLGTVVPNFFSISFSYDNAKSALSKCFYKGYGSIVSGKFEPSQITAADKEIQNHFAQALENGKNNEIFECLQNIYLDLCKNANTDIEIAKNLYYKISLKLLNHLQNYGITTMALKTNDNSIRNSIFASHTLQDVNTYVTGFLNSYIDYIEKTKGNSNISKIIDFIEAKYTQSSLDINTISQNTFLSPAYLCTYFKKETGKTINQYINEYRLSKAVEFLKDKKYRISDVAVLIGFEDGNYFTRVFKKKYGITPSEYRERLGLTI